MVKGKIEIEISNDIDIEKLTIFLDVLSEISKIMNIKTLIAYGNKND